MTALRVVIFIGFGGVILLLNTVVPQTWTSWHDRSASRVSGRTGSDFFSRAA